MSIVHAGLAPVRVPPLDPDSEKTYGVDWSEFLGTRVMVSSAWIVPAGITSIAEQTDVTVIVGDVAHTHVNTIKLTGGVVGQYYTVTNRVVHSEGSEDRSIVVPCVEL